MWECRISEKRTLARIIRAVRKFGAKAEVPAFALNAKKTGRKKRKPR